MKKHTSLYLFLVLALTLTVFLVGCDIHTDKTPEHTRSETDTTTDI